MLNDEKFFFLISLKSNDAEKESSLASVYKPPGIVRVTHLYALMKKINCREQVVKWEENLLLYIHIFMTCGTNRDSSLILLYKFACVLEPIHLCVLITKVHWKEEILLF